MILPGLLRSDKPACCCHDVTREEKVSKLETFDQIYKQTVVLHLMKDDVDQDRFQTLVLVDLVETSRMTQKQSKGPRKSLRGDRILKICNEIISILFLWSRKRFLGDDSTHFGLEKMLIFLQLLALSFMYRSF